MVRDSAVEAPRAAVLGEMVSFAAVGGTAALAFVILSAVLTSLDTGMPAWVVSAGCYALFIVPVYLAHRRLSFHSQMPHAVALPRYVAVQASALALASLFSFVCYGLIGMPSALAAVVVICLTSGVNFVVLKLWAFAQRS
jgi:putative flippase GtrA